MLNIIEKLLFCIQGSWALTLDGAVVVVKTDNNQGLDPALLLSSLTHLGKLHISLCLSSANCKGR